MMETRLWEYIYKLLQAYESTWTEPLKPYNLFQVYSIFLHILLVFLGGKMVKQTKSHDLASLVVIVALFPP